MINQHPAQQGSLGGITIPSPSTAIEQYLYTLNLHEDATHVLFKLIEDHLRFLRDLFDSQVPRGYVVGIEVVVGAQSREEVRFDPPLFTVAITNAGPGTVQYRVPASAGSAPITLLSGGTDSAAFNQAKISTVGLVTPGQAAAVRIIGTY